MNKKEQEALDLVKNAHLILFCLTVLLNLTFVQPNGFSL